MVHEVINLDNTVISDIFAHDLLFGLYFFPDGSIKRIKAILVLTLLERRVPGS